MSEWAPIEDFPGYYVSHDGRVCRSDTGYVMSLTRNQQGVIMVGLSRDGRQYKRGVALLVAKAFLEPPALETFTTPIHLDGDLSNNRAENLMWRPRWFSMKYHAQFHNDIRGFRGPIIEIHTQEKFPNSWAAAKKYGLLDRDIYLATLNRTYVFPTFQEFRQLDY
jgi:hypothetical protein